MKLKILIIFCLVSVFGATPVALSAPETLSSRISSDLGTAEAELRALLEKLGVVREAVSKTGSTTSCNQCVAKTVSTETPDHPLLPSNLKSEAELSRYVSCYSDHPDLTKAYEERYREYIRVASQEFAIPETMLTCLIFRESQFQPDAQSTIVRRKPNRRVHGRVVKGALIKEKGASGIGQFMPKTEATLSAMIAAQTIRPEKIAHLREIAENGDKNHNAKDQAYSEAKVDSYDLALHWNAYFDHLKKKGLLPLNKPNSFTSKDALDPEVSIGATAFYVRYITDFLQDELNSRHHVSTGPKSAPDLDFMLTVVGSYNMGHGAAKEILKGVRPASTEAWMRRLQMANHETDGHIQSIRNCMIPGNFQPTVGTPVRTCK